MGILQTLGTATDPRLFGANGSPIKSLDFYEVPPHARYVIAKIRRQGAVGEKFWNPLRDGSTVFENKGNDLPAHSAYREYTVLQVSANEGGTYYNPFFLVTGITDQHTAYGPGF